MNNEMMVSGAENNTPHTFDRKELIEGVVQKHKRFLDEYNSEFSELESKMKELRNNIDSAKNNRVEVLEKIEILAEKRQLFYHQAEKLLDEIESSISGNADLSRQFFPVKEKLSKVKGSLTPDEEEKQVDIILKSISSLASGMSGMEDRLAAVQDMINGALSSKKELSSIDVSEDEYNSMISSYEESIIEIDPRYKWLENRIKSHKDALEYWQKQPLFDAEEVKA